MQQLLVLRDKYYQELSVLPEFQNYIAICKTIELLSESKSNLPTTFSSINEGGLLTTPEQKEAMLNAVDDYFRQSHNKPTPMKKLREALAERKVSIPGQNPGTTLGAILTGQKSKYMLRNKLWSAIQENKKYTEQSAFSHLAA